MISSRPPKPNVPTSRPNTSREWSESTNCCATQVACPISTSNSCTRRPRAATNAPRISSATNWSVTLFTTRSRARVSEQLDVLIPPGFRYGYKAWTHEDHRRRHLSKMRGHFHFTTVPRPYEERGIWYVETHNYMSLLHSYVHPRQRAMRMGYCGWLTLFGRQIPFNTRAAKWIGFEFVRRSDDGRRQYI